MVMRLGYESFTSNPETSTVQLGYAALFFYGLVALSLVVAFKLGEGALIGYAVGAFFAGAYRSPRRRK